MDFRAISYAAGSNYHEHRRVSEARRDRLLFGLFPYGSWIPLNPSQRPQWSDVMGGLRQILVDSPNSLGAKARARRADRLVNTFPDLRDMRVIDLGGTLDFWQRLPYQPRHLTTLNLWEDANAFTKDVDWHTDSYGDACEPPEDVLAGSYDLVFSNSTIEHVGDRGRRQMFADVVRKLADRHWIQTPNRAFPLEPHVLFPGHQFLPRYARGLVEMYWPLVHTRWETMEDALASADNTELIGKKEMVELFPSSVIEDEIVAPLLPAKSLIAVRR